MKVKIYSFGSQDAKTLLLLPGTCCHWKSNFGHVIPLLMQDYHVLCVSYDGFDETERTEFPTMLEETEKIEKYIREHCGGRIHGTLHTSPAIITPDTLYAFTGPMAARWADRSSVC